MLGQEMQDAQDDCLLAISEGRAVPSARLRVLFPWRAVLIARITIKAGLQMDMGTLQQIEAEAAEVTGKLDGGMLGPWWERGGV